MIACRQCPIGASFQLDAALVGVTLSELQDNGKMPAYLGCTLAKGEVMIGNRPKAFA